MIQAEYVAKLVQGNVEQALWSLQKRAVEHQVRLDGVPFAIFPQLGDTFLTFREAESAWPLLGEEPTMRPRDAKGQLVAPILERRRHGVPAQRQLGHPWPFPSGSRALECVDVPLRWHVDHDGRTGVRRPTESVTRARAWRLAAITAEREERSHADGESWPNAHPLLGHELEVVLPSFVRHLG